MDRRWLLLWVLVGCASLEREAPVATSVAAAPAGATEAAGDGSAAGAAAAVAAKGLAAERMVIREASLRLRSADPRKAADKAARIAEQAGGFVLNSALRTVDGEVREVEVQLRVPQQSLEATLHKVRGLGTVLVETVSGQDVTEEFVDVSARLRAARTLETRLLALLQNAAALKDLLVVEQELARVRGDIEQKEGRIRYLQERARMAAVQVVAEAPGQPMVASAQALSSRLANAFDRALEGAISVTEVLITLTGFSIPLLLLAGSVAIPVLWLRRRRIAARHAPLAM